MREPEVLFALDLFVRDGLVFAAFVAQDPQEEASGKDPDRAAPDVFLFEEAHPESIHDVLVGAAAVQITAGLECHRDRLGRAGRDLVTLMEITDRPAV